MEKNAFLLPHLSLGNTELYMVLSTHVDGRRITGGKSDFPVMLSAGLSGLGRPL